MSVSRVVEIQQWEMRAAKEPLARSGRSVEDLAPGTVLVRVAGCGVCHTDIGFFQGDVKTNHALPLVLGHEIAGWVEAAGALAQDWIGKPVVVPAVLPCGDAACSPCSRGRYALCPKQIFPGNDIDGGFASHVVVPARWLCPTRAGNAEQLAKLSVIADALSTPWEAIERSYLKEGDVAVWVGVGGVGGFGVQLAAARGATVIAVDPSAARRELVLQHGATAAFDPSAQDLPTLRKAVRAFAKERGLPAEEWKVFETSGTAPGQETAFALLNRGGHLGVVGFTSAKVTVPLSHLMAFDARAEGNWGCSPERYPELVKLAESGKIALDPFLDIRPMSEINQVFTEMIEHRLTRRAVLIPDF